MPGSNVSQHLQLTNISGWSFKRNLLLLKLHFLIFALKQKWNITSGHRWSTKPQKHIISPVIWVTKGGKVRGTNRWISNFKVEKTPCVHELTRREWPSGQSAGLWVGRPGFKSWMGHYVVALSKSLHSPCFVFSDKTLSRRSRLLQGLG